MRRILSTKHVPLVLLLSVLWFAGSTIWYVCETQELCTDKDVVKEKTIEEPVEVATPDPDPVQEPVVEAFDTSRQLTVYFNSNAATFVDRSWESELDEFASYLIDTPSANINIDGYTAYAAPNGNESSLSQGRADAVEAYLLQSGVPASQITTAAKSGLNPVADNTTPEGQALNQRAVVSFN